MDGGELQGWTAAEIAARTGASEPTARRWKAARRLPAMVAQLVRLAILGDLSSFDPAWRGWSVSGGTLCGPDGFTFTPAEILSLPFLTRALEAARARNRFAVQADFIDGRYIEPASDGTQGV